MAGDYLLDTNIVIALLNGDSTVGDQCDLAQSVLLSSVTLGELYFGVLASSRVAENQGRLEEFASEVVTLPCDQHTAKHYGILKQQLHQAGRPIPNNDMWIAACAIQHQLDLVTRDGHFNGIAGLDIVRW